MAVAISQIAVGQTATLLFTATADRRIVVSTLGGSGIYIGKDTNVTVTTGFFLGANTTEVSHPLVLDLQNGDSLYAISAKGEESQIAYLLVYVPVKGV